MADAPTPYEAITTPLTLRGKTLKNRIVFGAHTANMAVDGLPSERHLGYYLERAIGGAAMIVVEPNPVHQTAILTRGNFRHSDDAVIEPFQRITNAVHEHDTLILQQLYHVGAHGDADNSYAPNWSASGQPSYHDSDGSHAMRAHEIEQIITAFATAARRCQRAGFDGVDIFAAYHSLLDQFWSKWSNKRTDEWGGTLENRTRLSRDIVSAIRAECGDDFLIGMSISWSEKTPWMLSLDEFKEIIALHDKAGEVDYFSCGVGNYFDVEKIMPTFVHEEKLGVPLSRALKEVVQHARVTAEAHIRTPEHANAVLRANDADLVSIVRGQIADPHWVNKVSEGRSDDIRGCISCNQMCWGRRSRDYAISCLINPSAGREFEWGGDRFTPAQQLRNIVVVGAGPAGLEAARVAAARGHRVRLFEAQTQIGGQFRFAGLAPRRGQIIELLDWYERQFIQLGVEVSYSSYLETSDITALAADHVVLATGSRVNEDVFQRWLPNEETLPGLANGNVHGCDELYLRIVTPGNHVVLLDEGGNWKGMGTAWYLAERGHRVSVVTADPFFGKELVRTMADHRIRAALAQYDVTVYPETIISHWYGDGAELSSLLSGERQRIHADTLITTTTNIANRELADELNQAGIACDAIGDCVAARQAPYAFYEGRALALRL